MFDPPFKHMRLYCLRSFTLQIMQRAEWGGGVHFFGRGDDEDLRLLEELLASNVVQTEGGPSNRVGGIFTEFPSNPLLGCPPLRQLGSLVRRYGVGGGLVVDDTLGSFANLDLLQCSGKIRRACGTAHTAGFQNAINVDTYHGFIRLIIISIP